MTNGLFNPRPRAARGAVLPPAFVTVVGRVSRCTLVFMLVPLDAGATVAADAVALIGRGKALHPPASEYLLTVPPGVRSKHVRRRVNVPSAGGRTWIRSRDLLLVREAPSAGPATRRPDREGRSSLHVLVLRKRTSAELVSRPLPATTIPPGPRPPHPISSKRTDFGCRWVADGHLGRIAEGVKSTKSLQIIGGPQRVRTADLRRAKAFPRQDRTRAALNPPLRLRYWP